MHGSISMSESFMYICTHENIMLITYLLYQKLFMKQLICVKLFMSYHPETILLFFGHGDLDPHQMHF